MDLLAAAEAGPLDELGWARIDLLRAQIAFASSRGNEVPPLLLAAAKRLETLDIELARDTYPDTFSAAMFAGRLAGTANSVQVAAAPARAPAGETRKGDILLEGLASLFTDGYAAAMPLARRALQAFSVEDLSVSEGLRWLWLASVISVDV